MLEKICDTDETDFVHCFLQFFIVLLIILLAELILLILFFVYTDKVRLSKLYSYDPVLLKVNLPTYPMIHLFTSVCPGERKCHAGSKRRTGAVQHG